MKPSPAFYQVICVCMLTPREHVHVCFHMHVGGCMHVVEWMWRKSHTPEGVQAEEHSLIYARHTIWVARLQAQAETAVCVSEVKRRRKEAKNWEFSIHIPISPLSLYSPPAHTHTHTHTVIHMLKPVKNFQPSSAWDATQCCSLRSLQALLWDSSANIEAKE